MRAGFRTTAIVLISLLGASGTAGAGVLDPTAVRVVYDDAGLQNLQRIGPLTRVFEFAPLTAASGNAIIPGFSDPLGAGSDPTFKAFSGSVQFMDLLGDYHPPNPYDERDLTPTPESVQSAQLVSFLLSITGTADQNALVNSQLDVENASPAQFSVRPVTTETSPLSLTELGNVSESAAKPVPLHWTHCPDYDLTRYLVKRALKPNPAIKWPPLDCFVM